MEAYNVISVFEESSARIRLSYPLYVAFLVFLSMCCRFYVEASHHHSKSGVSPAHAYEDSARTYKIQMNTLLC